MSMLNFKRKDILLKSFIFTLFFFFNIPFHDGSSQGIEYSSLCYTVDRVVYLLYRYCFISANPTLPVLPSTTRIEVFKYKLYTLT